ncbi:MAG: hypothetical protein ABI336_08825 [Humibacillus sp.]
MSTHPTWRTTSTTAVALAIALGALGACSKAEPTAPTAAAAAVSTDQAGPTGSDTIDLVNAALDLPAVDTASAKGDHKGLRARLLRAVHATWVTDGKAGAVTHQAIRGDVTAVSSTSITVRAKDGVSMTFSVGPDTKVRYRAAGPAGSNGKVGTSGKATASSIGTVKVGEKALVVGVGATAPVAKVLMHRPAVTAAPTVTPAPGATS